MQPVSCISSHDMACAETDIECFDACDRFFSIHELVALFLHSAPPLVLLKCQRVCKLWNEMITQSQICQENMFLKPIEQDFSKGPVEPQINPILWECFGPVLALKSPNGSASSLLSKYEDIEHLPWARDGISLEAPARKAYARPEASWRGMYVSQPPIQRLDWWHSFTCEETLPRRTEPISGWGHQYEHDRPITIGMLWDLVECRLKRGCEAQVVYFPNGSSAFGDETALEIERYWESDLTDCHHGYTTSMPRVKISTHHVWPGTGPNNSMKFNMQKGAWERIHCQYHRYPDDDDDDDDDYPFQHQVDSCCQCGCPIIYFRDGFNWMRQDCRADLREGMRWSKADEFRWPEICGDSSGEL